MTETIEILKFAYRNGYKSYENSMVEIPENVNNRGFILEGYGSLSWSNTVREIEDMLGFDRENEDWDNQGIYGIIEDSSVAYEAGAMDALKDKENNPERINFLWDY